MTVNGKFNFVPSDISLDWDYEEVLTVMNLRLI